MFTVLGVQRPLTILAIALLFMVAGCQSFSKGFPSEGYGGFAEHRMGLSGSLASDHQRSPFNAVLGNGYSKRGNGLKSWTEARYVKDVALLTNEERLEWLRSRGAERCAPGDFHKAELLLTRVKREWVGDLKADAAVSLEQLKHRMEVLEERVFKNNCQPGGGKVISYEQTASTFSNAPPSQIESAVLPPINLDAAAQSPPTSLEPPAN